MHDLTSGGADRVVDAALIWPLLMAAVRYGSTLICYRRLTK